MLTPTPGPGESCEEDANEGDNRGGKVWGEVSGLKASHEDKGNGDLSHRHLDSSLNEEGLAAASIDYKQGGCRHRRWSESGSKTQTELNVEPELTICVWFWNSRSNQFWDWFLVESMIRTSTELKLNWRVVNRSDREDDVRAGQE